MEVEGKSFPNVKERRGMIKKFKVRVDGKEYSVEVESVEEEKGLKGTPREHEPHFRRNNCRGEEAGCRASTFSNKGEVCGCADAGGCGKNKLQAR